MRYLVIAISLIISLGSKAQDIHFTQFYDSPLNLNPSLTGDFNGSYRFVGNYKRQWASISQGEFNTTSISADAKDFLKVKNLGLGLLLFQDIAGDSRMQDLRASLSLSYNFRLTSDSAHQLRIGALMGYNQMSIDYSQLRYGDQFNGNRFDPSLASSEVQGANALQYLVSNLGFSYVFSGKKIEQIKLGFAAANFQGPMMNFLPGDAAILERRYTFHAQAILPLITNWYLEPFALYMSQGVYRQANIGSSIRYDIDPRKYNYRAVFAGLGTRWGDAANITAGLYYGAWKFGLSYDINYSLLNRASNYRGGPEIAVIYIMPGLLPKRMRYKYCPDYL